MRFDFRYLSRSEIDKDESVVHSRMKLSLL